MTKIENGPNWEDDLGGEFSRRSADKNFADMQKEMYGQFEQTFMMYLPRLCEHCLNPPVSRPVRAALSTNVRKTASSLSIRTNAAAGVCA